MTVIMCHRCTSGEVNKTTIVVATEITKILIATLIISCYDKKERAKVFENWSVNDSLKVAALPATLYAIQNLLVQYAYDYLPSMTFNLLNQTKVFAFSLRCTLVIITL
jgi:solute carrier family 35 (UDP-sugar transporter), member A1/2/3